MQVFTEDERKGPKDAFDFLASIGGAIYSRKVIAKLADTFYAQARYDRAIESERFLIKLDPDDEASPDRQKRIVEALREMDENKEAVKELRKLAETYGPGSDWAKAQQNPKAVEHAHELAADMLREVAKELHADAQHDEQQQKGHIDVDRYARAADAYAYYLSQVRRATPTPSRSHYLLGDIYFFKLKKYEEAGDAYLAVGQVEAGRQAAPEALLQAIASYEKVRRDHRRAARRSSCRRTRSMGEAIDLYATLFPKDPEIANILYKNGAALLRLRRIRRSGEALWFDRREISRRKRWRRRPATRSSSRSTRRKDYENVESWARRLLKVPAFQSARPIRSASSKLVVDAGMKAGEQKAEKDPLGARPRSTCAWPTSSRPRRARRRR